MLSSHQVLDGAAAAGATIGGSQAGEDGRVQAHAGKALASQARMLRGGRSGPSTANGPTLTTQSANTRVANSGMGTLGTVFRIAPAEQQDAQALHLCESAATAAVASGPGPLLAEASPASPVGAGTAV